MAESGKLTGEDEQNIAALMVRYATGIDRRDWTLFRSCFTDDFQGDYGAFGTWSSGDAITADMVKMHLPFGHTLHRMTNTAASATSYGAEARTYVDVILMPLEAGAPAAQAAGFYDDELVKAADGWKLRRRRFTIVRGP